MSKYSYEEKSEIIFFEKNNNTFSLNIGEHYDLQKKKVGRKSDRTKGKT